VLTRGQAPLSAGLSGIVESGVPQLLPAPGFVVAVRVITFRLVGLGIDLRHVRSSINVQRDGRSTGARQSFPFILPRPEAAKLDGQLAVARHVDVVWF
jgi:hypothetical protein